MASSKRDDDEYMENAENVAFVSLGSVLSKDDSFNELLERPAGSAFVCDGVTGEFIADSSEN